MRQGNRSSETFPSAQTRSGDYYIMCSCNLWGVTSAALTTISEFIGLISALSPY